MASLAGLDADEALRRYGLGRGVDRLDKDEATGKHYRLMIFAVAVPWNETEITVTVSVTAEPRVVRHARRFKAVAELIEGWRDAGRTETVTKVLPLAGPSTGYPSPEPGSAA
jgi:hypothetical protein